MAESANDYESRLWADFESLPGEDDLPCEDGQPVESHKHRLQASLLLHPLARHWRDRDDYFAGANMFLYYRLAQVDRNEFRGPDFFVALGTERRARKSWVTWREDAGIYLVVEVTSPSTRREDHTNKKRVYAGHPLRIPVYVIFDPEDGALEGFRLEADVLEYLPVVPSVNRRLPCKAMNLELGLWDGEYMGVEGPWLRWYTPAGDLVATPEEAELVEAQRADDAAQRADDEAQRADEEARLRREAEATNATLMAELSKLRAES